jgi:phosphoribosylglycinamide formyltransferase 1
MKALAEPVAPKQNCKLMPDAKLKLGVLISGSGRTLKNFIDLAAEDQLPVDVRLVISSNPSAGGLKFAEAAGIPARVVRREDFGTGSAGDEAFGDAIFSACREAGVDYVTMAGFLKFAPVPDDFIGRVVNIHPALIPAFCGHGMYGDRVHQAVLDAGVKVTGCTVHFVDNQYDHGPIIWQQPVPVFDDDTADTLGKRVFEVEKEAYPHVLRLLAAGRVKLEGGRVVTFKPQRGESRRAGTGAYPID